MLLLGKNFEPAQLCYHASEFMACHEMGMPNGRRYYFKLKRIKINIIFDILMRILWYS